MKFGKNKSIRGCINAVYMCIVLCLYLFTVIFFLLCYAIMLYRCPDIELLCVILSTNRKRHICTPWYTTNICINIQTPHLSIVHLREKKNGQAPPLWQLFIEQKQHFARAILLFVGVLILREQIYKQCINEY